MSKVSKLFSWLMLPALLVLYLTGTHQKVKAKVQQQLLEAGFFMSEPSVTAGHKIPANYNLSLKTLDGQSVSMRTMKDKVIFMNIWASWCPPCVAEMPNIHKLYHQMDTTKVAFVMLSVDEYDKALRNFMERKQYTFPVYTAVGAIPDVYASPSIPCTFVIDKEGEIVFRHDGMANYNTADFREFLNKLAAE